MAGEFLSVLWSSENLWAWGVQKPQPDVKGVLKGEV